MKAKIANATVKVFRLRFKGTNGQYRYNMAHNIETARRRILWWMIWDAMYFKWPPVENSYREWRGRPACACDSWYASENHPEWELCPLHNREDGYLARLHKRLTRLSEKGLLPSLIMDVDDDG